MSNNIPADGEAMPKTAVPRSTMTPGTSARSWRLQLSRAMAQNGDDEFAYIRPAGKEFPASSVMLVWQCPKVSSSFLLTGWSIFQNA